MPEVKIARYVDYEDGSLLVLAADFSLVCGRAFRDGKDFAWWMDENDEVIGFSYDGLRREGGHGELFLRSFDFRIAVPQLRLAAASVYEVVQAARRYFILEGHCSPAAEAHARARCAVADGDPYEALQAWVCLYHVYGDVDGLFGIGSTLVELGVPAQAVTTLKAFLNLRPDDAWAHRYLGCAYLSLGDNTAARHHWQKAVECEAGTGCDTGAAVLLEDLATACASSCSGNCPGSAGLQG